MIFPSLEKRCVKQESVPDSKNQIKLTIIKQTKQTNKQTENKPTTNILTLSNQKFS